MRRIKDCFIGIAVLGCVVAANGQSAFGLRVDIDVSAKTSTKQVGAGDDGELKNEQVQINVKVRKAGGGEYTDPLTLELYVIGKQIHTGYYGIIDVVKQEFIFNKEDDNSYRLASKMYNLPRTTGNIDAGGTYETYLVVVVDKDGKIVDTRSGRVIKEKGINFIRELGPMTLFDRDGNVLGKVENPGQAVRIAAPAALSSGIRHD